MLWFKKIKGHKFSHTCYIWYSVLHSLLWCFLIVLPAYSSAPAALNLPFYGAWMSLLCPLIQMFLMLQFCYIFFFLFWPFTMFSFNKGHVTLFINLKLNSLWVFNSLWAFLSKVLWINEKNYSYLCYMPELKC